MAEEYKYSDKKNPQSMSTEELCFFFFFCNILAIEAFSQLKYGLKITKIGL